MKQIKSNVKGVWLYFADTMGDLKDEAKKIQTKLGSYDINVKLKTTISPPWDEVYDVIFFDYGGMSIGNSMLESFCEYFIEQAREHPQRLYIMTSSFTKNAMNDLLEHLDRETDVVPKNIFLDIESAIKLLKEWYLI